MNKTNKRYMNLRNKLFAAIAMLLVSSIMMVSSTYAWFTLSTAPEVQGITTTVGANGNLEIALSPQSGRGTDVVDGSVGVSGQDWTVKNLTWGNLLDLSDTSYGLADLVLSPAQLVLSGNSLPSAPLATPVYGNDGRIADLDDNTIIGGKTVVTGTENTLSDGYSVGGVRGVRAVGTASSMSEQTLAKTKGMAAIKKGQEDAVRAASTSLSANGNALANMLVAHAMAGASDTNEYKDYVDELTALVTGLSNSSKAIGESIRGMLLAAASTIEDTTAFTSAKSVIENTASVEELLGKTEVESLVSSNATLTQLITAWREINADVTAAVNAVTPLATLTTVDWDDVSPVLTYLMDTATSADAVLINGDTIDEVKKHMDDYAYLLNLAKDLKITMGAGSGIYYDIALIAGNIQSNMSAAIMYQGSEIPVDASISTTAPSPFMLDTLYTAANGITPAGGEAKAVIDVYYGYILDFMFRTNVSGSYLKLLTDGAQRIYSDATNQDTMGNGSTFTFEFNETPAEGEEKVTAAMVKGLVESLRVVFFDPDTNQVYGVAKATSTSTNDNEVVGYLELCAVTVADGTGYATADNANGSDKLCDLSQNTAKALSVMVMLDGNNITNNNILAEGNLTGALNLQFGSSAALAPMQNQALKTGDVDDETPDVGDEDDEQDNKYTVTFTVNNAIIDPETTSVEVEAGESYTFKATPATNYNVVQVTYGGRTYYDENDGNFTVTPTGDMTVEVNGYVSGNQG